MGVYISGLEMPQNGRITLQIDSNGGVYVVNKFNIISEKYEKSMTATGIKPHGKLGDLEMLYDEVNRADDYGASMSDVFRLILQAPTVIEADGERDERYYF